MTLDFSSSVGGSVTVTLHRSQPPNFPEAVPVYWEVDGSALPDPFVARLSFVYTPALLDRAGLSDTQFEIYKSGDGGTSWAPVPTAYGSLVATTDTDQTSFSLWTLGPVSESSTRDWWLLH